MRMLTRRATLLGAPAQMVLPNGSSPLCWRHRRSRRNKGAWSPYIHKQHCCQQQSRGCISVHCATAPQQELQQQQQQAAVLVWYKHDLRTDDHGGLRLAADRAQQLGGGAPIIPAFVLDPLQWRHLLRMPSGLQGLLGAVQALKAALRSRGSDLIVRCGPVAQTMAELAQQTNAAEIILEEEVEYGWQAAVDDVAAMLSHVRLMRWRTQMFAGAPYPASWPRFQQTRGAPLELPPCPPQLPAVPDMHAAEQSQEDWLGSLPDAHALRGLVAEQAAARQTPEVAAVGQALPEDADLLGGMAARLQGGEPAAQQLLQAFLACLSAGQQGGRSADAALSQAVQQAERPASVGGSFPAVFAQAMALGTLSRRRVHADARRTLAKARRGSPQWRMGAGPRPDAPARSALATVESMEFHWHLAAADQVRETKIGTAPRHWRWRGFLTDYFTAEAGAAWRQSDSAAERRAPGRDRPAFLLVHGFGAFGEQWRGQIRALTDAGYQCYAPTLPGYGRSEKPALAYSQELWRDFLRDFVLDVVQRPVVVVGNSIGGYLCASLAGDYPDLVAGLILMNSAGKVEAGYRAPAASAQPAPAGSGPPRLLVELISRGLYLYLQGSVAKTLTRLYPNAPSQADEWLVQEITRAADDAGARGVFRSVFYLPKPRPLNHLVNDLFGGPTLCLSGVNDPLADKRKQADALVATCSNVTVQLVEAGHCPMDETPRLVNAALLDFMQTRVLPQDNAAMAVKAPVQAAA